MKWKWLLWRIIKESKELVTKGGHLFASFMPVAVSMCTVHPISCHFIHTFSLSEFQLHSYKKWIRYNWMKKVVWWLCEAGQFWIGYGGKSSFWKSKVIFFFFLQILCQLFVSTHYFTLSQNLSLPMFHSFYWLKNEQVLFQIIKTSASSLMCHFKFKLFHQVASLLRAFGNLNHLCKFVQPWDSIRIIWKYLNM